jgi:hypothetical protein
MGPFSQPFDYATDCGVLANTFSDLGAIETDIGSIPAGSPSAYAGTPEETNVTSVARTISTAG